MCVRIHVRACVRVRCVCALFLSISPSGTGSPTLGAYARARAGVRACVRACVRAFLSRLAISLSVSATDFWPFFSSRANVVNFL